MLTAFFVFFLGAVALIGFPLTATVLRKKLRQTKPSARADAIKAGIWGSWITWGSIIGTGIAVLSPDGSFYLIPLPISIALSWYFSKTD